MTGGMCGRGMHGEGHGCSGWQVGGLRGRRSTWYASYWNAFLFILRSRSPVRLQGHDYIS